MITITIGPTELFDEKTMEFIQVKGQKISLEHSLVSVARWESKWKKPYLSKYPEKTFEEVVDYIRCMTITQNVNPLVYKCLSDENILEIGRYIEDPMSATTFRSITGQRQSVMTSEYIYYAMFANNVPKECEKWHLNRLLNLLTIFSKNNQPKNKQQEMQSLQERRALNEMRKAKYHTKG